MENTYEDFYWYLGKERAEVIEHAKEKKIIGDVPKIFFKVLLMV